MGVSCPFSTSYAGIQVADAARVALPSAALPGRDDRAGSSPRHSSSVARATFTELLIRYPRSRRDAEARARQAALTDLLVREDEGRRYSQRLQRTEEDRRRTKTNLEWLKQSDLDREPRR